MAPDSDIASEKSEACPREDLVLALMEYLVDPRLPSRVSDNDPPDLSVQQAVSKQMHAVVLLYNYFHRKQHPDIEFLDFVAFCKLSVIMRPTMSAFMKFTNQGESTELNDINDGLSVTEKAIRDACNISVVLDVSKDVPDTEGWPISKVAVLLIDSNKENCLLQFGSVTEGIWSLVEKELDESIINSEISAEETVGNKRKRNSRTSTYLKDADDNGLLQLAFDAVKEETGINSSDLVVLEMHIVYSLSKEKTAALVYIMQWTQSINEYEGFPVEDVVKSLQGPLVEKTFGCWTIRPVVEYYHMNPYAGIMSRCILRTCSSMPSLDKGKCSSSGKESSPINISWRTDKDDKGTEKFNERCEITNSAKQNGGKEWWKRINPEFFNQNGGKDWPKGSPSGPYGEPQRKDMDAFPKTSLRNEDAKKNQISKLGVHCKKKNSSSRQIDACAPIGGVDTEVEMVDSLKSNGIRDRDGKVSGENCYVTISSNQNGIPLASSEPVPFEPNNKNIEEVQNTPASEALQNALTLLYRRRHEVYSQLCSMEDELILYEGNIERIRDGGEVGLALQCIESITNVHNSVSSKSENQAQDHTFQPGDHSESKQKRQMRLADTFLSSKSENQAQDKAFQPDEDHCVSQQKRQMRLSVTLLSKSENQAQDKDFQPGEDHCDSQQKEQIRLSNTFLPRNSEQLMANAILKETEEENFPPHFTILAPFVDEVASNVPDAIVRDYIEQGDALVEDVSFSEAVPSYSCSMPTVADQVPLERSNCVVQHFQQEVWDRLTPIEQLPFEMSNSVDQQFQQEVRDRLTAMERLPFEMSNCVDQQFQQVRDRLTAIEQNLEILDVRFTSLGQRFTDTIDGFQQNLNHVQLYCKEEFQHFDAKFTSLGQRFTDTIDGLQQNLNHVELCCKEEFQHFGTKFNTVIGMLESLINVQQPCPEFKQSGQSEQLGGFKQAGDTGAGPSYTPSSLIYSFVSQFNTEVGPEGAFVYKGRGHCAKKKSKILRSSYTNPDRREQHALDTFNILREINPSKELSFQSWYQSAKDTDTVDLTILVANKPWFSKLVNGDWVEGEHIDVAMLLIRLRTESHPRMFLPRYAILDSTFGQCIYDLWHEGGHRFEPTQVKYPGNIQWYVNGEWPSHGMSWSLCEHMLIPFNIVQSHWVTLDIDLLAWELTVYDGDIACYVDAVMQEKVTCFLTLIPLIFKITGVFEQREWWHKGPLKFVRKKKTEIPQTKKSGDCGIYAIKYVECLAAGRSVDVVTDENMLFWRRKLAAEMYSKEFDP